MGKRLVLLALVLLGACGGDDDEGRRVSVEAATDAETTTTSTMPAEEDDEETTTTAAPGDSTTSSSTPSSAPARTGATTTTTSAGRATTTTSMAGSTTTTTAAPQPATYPRDAGTADSRVVVTLTLDRTEIPAKGVLTVENRSDDEVRMERGGCDFTWGLYRNGTYVGGHERIACPAHLFNDRLRPREVRRYEMTFDGFDDGEPRRPIPAGTYDAFAGWSVIGGNWYAPPVTVTIR